jgi:hypothetical protein
MVVRAAAEKIAVWFALTLPSGGEVFSNVAFSRVLGFVGHHAESGISICRDLVKV